MQQKAETLSVAPVGRKVNIIGNDSLDRFIGIRALLASGSGFSPDKPIQVQSFLLQPCRGAKSHKP